MRREQHDDERLSGCGDRRNSSGHGSECTRFRLLLSGLSGSRVGVELPCSHRAGRMPHPNAINANLCRALDREKAREQTTKARRKRGKRTKERDIFTFSPFFVLFFSSFSPLFFSPFFCRFCFIKRQAFLAFFKFVRRMFLIPNIPGIRISLIDEISLFNPAWIIRYDRSNVSNPNRRTRTKREEPAAVARLIRWTSERTTDPGEETVLLHPLPASCRSPVVATSRRFPRRRREYSWTVRACRRSHPPGRHETSRRTEIRKGTSEAAVKCGGGEGGREGYGISIEFSKRGWARESGNFLAGIETRVNPDDAGENVSRAQSSSWIVKRTRRLFYAREKWASIWTESHCHASREWTDYVRVCVLFFSFRTSAIESVSIPAAV